MIGPKKLSEIRAELRHAFGKSDSELRVWFNQKRDEMAAKKNASEGVLKSLELLRDALVKEAKRGGRKKKARGKKVRVSKRQPNHDKEGIAGA